MKSEIIILNYLKGKTKDNKPFTRVQFAFTNVQDTEKYKGITILDCFYDNHEVYNKLSTDLILKRCSAEFDLKDDLYNPLSTRKILKKIDNIVLY